MKKINTSPITSTVGLPIKSGTLNHLQEAYREIVESAVRSLIGNAYSTGSFYKLYGCENTGSGSNYIISAGAIFYNGEIYLVDAATFTAAGGEVAVGTITTTNILAANADPVTLTNSTTANVHEVRKIVFASGVAGSSDVNFSALVGYIQSENYKDLSASVSVNPVFEVFSKSVRLYQDGTVSVNVILSYDGVIPADTLILSGLPAGAVYSIPARISGSGGHQHVNLRQNDILNPGSLYADQSLADLEPSAGDKTALGISYYYKKTL